MLPTTENPMSSTRLHGYSTSNHNEAANIMRMITGYTFIVLDNSNVLRGGFGHGFRIDPALVLQHLRGDKLVSATMSVSAAANDRPSQVGYYQWVRRLGWTVNTFELLRDSAGKLVEDEVQVDGDVRTQIRAATRSAYCDTIVVFAGDGGYTNAVKEARDAGKTVVVLAWAGTLHPALAAAASAHARIDSLRSLIGRALH